MPIQIMYRLPDDENGDLLQQQIHDLDLLLLQSGEKDQAGTQAGDDAKEILRQRRAELVGQLPEVTWMRVTVRELSRMDYAHYEALWDEGRTWFEEETGREVTDELGEFTELGLLRRAVLLRAGMLASVRRTTDYRKGTTVYHGDICKVWADTVPGPGEDWEASTIPPAWTTIEGMTGEMPYLLFGHWAEATHILNAGLLPLAPDFLAGTRVMTRRLAG